MDTYLNSLGYKFIQQSGGLYSYAKTDEGLDYKIMYAIQNNKVSAFSWNELSDKFNNIRTELSNMGFVLAQDSGSIRTYKNTKKNMMVSILHVGGLIQISIGAID